MLKLNQFKFLPLLGLVAGCGLWNDYEIPRTPEPEKFVGVQQNNEIKNSWPDKDWWKKFNSEELTNLIANAQSENYDIRAAVARIKEADAQAQIDSSTLWPSVDLSGDATRTREPIATANNTNFAAGVTKHRYVNNLNSSINASYELDFWGKNWSAAESGRALARASRYDAETLRLTTIADIANTYFSVLATQDRLEIARENLKAAQDLLNAINLRFKAGLATSLDVAEQQNLLASVQTTIPPLELQLRQNIDALAILMGKLPESDIVPQGKVGLLAKIDYPEIQAGLPSELLQRRPDVQEAEEDLRSASFDVTNAHAQFFPSIGLTAEGGIQSSALSNLFQPESLLVAAGADLAQPIFEGFALVGQYRLNKERYNELLSNYRKVALSAFSDVEDALAGVQQADAQEKAQRDVVKTAQVAYNGSITQFKGGIIDIRTLLDTQRSLFTAQDGLILVRLQHLEAIVSLYRVLGGGFDVKAQENIVQEVEKKAEPAKPAAAVKEPITPPPPAKFSPPEPQAVEDDSSYED